MRPDSRSSDIKVRLVAAGNEVGPGNQVGRPDGLLAEAQVRNGVAPGFLGIVGEIGLGVQSGISDDLHRLLVGAHGAVGAEAIELALDGSFGCGVDLLSPGQGKVGDIIQDAQGEPFFRTGRL